jgi:DNA-binding FadR family transcriptional regulator
MATQTRKRNRRTWQKLLQPIKLNARKRADCVLREARCAAEPGAVRAALEQAVAVEIERMRALHESEDTIGAFRAATELHIALCEREAAEHESSVRARKQPIALHGDDIAPA